MVKHENYAKHEHWKIGKPSNITRIGCVKWQPGNTTNLKHADQYDRLMNLCILSDKLIAIPISIRLISCIVDWLRTYHFVTHTSKKNKRMTPKKIELAIRRLDEEIAKLDTKNKEMKTGYNLYKNKDQKNKTRIQWNQNSKFKNIIKSLTKMEIKKRHSYFIARPLFVYRKRKTCQFFRTLII